ncbi:RNA 3'-terminal phosphate cyclase (ATP) [Pseudoalteromonas rubra]|uniref:RNA 3'-terminal phosphate cyclase n=2 Tax=Gammaproteobacteria TaxID=1236 RepID=A0A8T0C1R9_9GAMM|nr:RNA 3'-terminal phosphate cyclase [Pseudoalteromonas rubra]KAF7781604.1 RNA 3'-terminal phosphate cyclase (ATP) [Pseudoalteromonas rubra]
MQFLEIDGAQGEGGGQVLRTALTLSILTNTPIELNNIRANRNRPGLLRQHLTSVRAAQQICDATTEGVELGASRIRFTPGKVKSGVYHFSIGTAGSTVLVCQTILPVLALADGPSSVTFEGGTHNGMSPSLCFFKESYLPVLKEMGVTCQTQTRSLGFYPAGGGHWQLTIEPTAAFKQVALTSVDSEVELSQARCGLKALMSDLPDSIGQKEIAAARKALGWQDAESDVEQHQTNGRGNSFQIKIKGEHNTCVFEQIGELGVSAERVAKRCAGRVKQFLRSGAVVDAYLADQLLVPMALAGGGEFTTTEPSLHTRTNITVIRQFLDIDIDVQQETETRWKIVVGTKSS